MSRGRLRGVGVLPNKRDTPVKLALNRRDIPEGRKLLPSKRYEAFPEEPEEEMNVPTVLTSIKPVCCKSVSHCSTPACAENPRDKVSSAAPANKGVGYRASPAGHPTAPMTPEAFKDGEIPVNLTVTLESITSTGTTFSSDDEDDDEDENCYPSSSSSSSLPSPEVFRKGETLTFSFKDELPGLHLNIKNSTLLDGSQAETIHMYHPPNLSNIFDASTILAEKNCEINKNRGPEVQTKIHKDSFRSEEAFKWKTPTKLTHRKPISYKKKVWFKSPIIAETFEAKQTTASKLTIHKASKPDTDASRACEINPKEEAARLTKLLRRPVKNSLEKAKFFDFIDDSDRDAFFQRMKVRSVKLRSIPLFPLTVPKHTDFSVP